MNLQHWEYLRSGRYTWQETHEMWVSRLDGLVHSFNDQPAIIGNGFLLWADKDVVHRDNGPAKVFSETECEWFSDGKLTQSSFKGTITKHNGAMLHTLGWTRVR